MLTKKLRKKRLTIVAQPLFSETRTRKVAKLGTRTLHWLVRQLAKHEFVRVKAEEKPVLKKLSSPAKKE